MLKVGEIWIDETGYCEKNKTSYLKRFCKKIYYRLLNRREDATIDLIYSVQNIGKCDPLFKKHSSISCKNIEEDVVIIHQAYIIRDILFREIGRDGGVREELLREIIRREKESHRSSFIIRGRESF